MKRNLLLLILSAAAVSCLCLGMTACKKKNEDPPGDVHLLYEEWRDHCSVTGLEEGCKDEKIVVPATHDGLPVVEIEDGAFAGKEEVKQIVLPDSVKRIGNFAFADCTALETAELGSGLEEIGTCGFVNCTALSSVSLGSSLKTIGLEAFMSCTALEKIAFPATLEEIKGFAFSESGLKEAVIPDGVSHIGASAFYGAPLEKLRLGDLLDSIGSFAFAYTAVEEIVFEPVAYTDVGMCAFAFNDRLKTVQIGERCNSLPYGAFAMCTSLETVTMDASQVCDSAFGGCEKLASVYFSCSEEKWSDDMVGRESDDNPQNGYGNTYFMDADWYFYSENSNPDGRHWHYIVNRQREIWENPVTADPHLVFEKRGDGYAVTGLEESCTHEEIVLPKTYEGLPVTAVADGAFENREHIKRVDLSSVTEIGKNAFRGCTSLGEVVFSKRLKTIGEQAFSSTALKTVQLPDSIRTVESGAFAYCEAESVKIPRRAVLRPYAFYGCPALSSLQFEEGFNGLSEFVFAACPALTNLTLPESLTGIATYSFYQCGITELVVPKSVKVIGMGAFGLCESLETVVLQEGLKFIESYAFQQTAIKELILPDSVIGIGGNAFAFNDVLERVELGYGLSRCEYAAFAMCGNIRSVTIKNPLGVIADAAFGGCPSIEAVYFMGEEAE